MKDGYCEHHKPIDMGYIAWHAMATKRISQKYTQVKCKACKRYLFPDELNEPENKQSQKIIDKHEQYLEAHPKAKPVAKFIAHP